MSACLIAALAHAPMDGFGQVSVAVHTIPGVAVGASSTPGLFVVPLKMAPSLALIPLENLLIALVGAPFIRKLWGVDSTTAFYATVPGGLLDMTTLGPKPGQTRVSSP